MPIVGCPANGSSAPGVKMRVSYVPGPVTVGNVVSDRFISRAKGAISAGGHGSNTTHRAFPLNGLSVKTSTIR